MRISGSQSTSLNEPQAKVVKALVSGHVPTTVSVLLDIDTLRERETRQCLLPQQSSLQIDWETFVAELRANAPKLLHILTAVVSFSDHRNQTKVGSKHFPDIWDLMDAFTPWLLNGRDLIHHQSNQGRDYQDGRSATCT